MTQNDAEERDWARLRELAELREAAGEGLDVAGLPPVANPDMFDDADTVPLGRPSRVVVRGATPAELAAQREGFGRAAAMRGPRQAVLLPWSVVVGRTQPVWRTL